MHNHLTRDNKPWGECGDCDNRLARFEYLETEWFVVVDDLIGGFAISHINKPLSQQDFRRGEGELASFVSESMAKHMVFLHNSWLTQRLAEKRAWNNHDREYGMK